MLPGVQVLFAFRLAVPSSARVGDVTPLQQAVLLDPLIHGAFRGSVACAVGSSQALVEAAGQGASPAGGVSPARAWYCSWWLWSE